jgi:hypothetical protein
MRWAGYVASMGAKRNRDYWWGQMKSSAIWKTQRRWKDNIKTNLRERRWEGFDWIHLAEDVDNCRALVNTVMNFRVT